MGPPSHGYGAYRARITQGFRAPGAAMEEERRRPWRAGGVRLWWRRRESNPRPEPPRTGVYACSRRSVFVVRVARRPAGLTLRRLSSRLGVDVRTLRPAHFRTFAPASHGRGFRGT